MNNQQLFCTNCGTPLNNEDRFCPECGKAVSISAPPTSTAYQEPAQETAAPQADAGPRKRRFLRWGLVLVVILAFAVGGIVFWDSLPRPSPVFINSVAYHPGGNVLAGMRTSVTKPKDNAIKLWDLASGKERCTLDASTLGEMAAIRFSPDGKTLVAGHRGGCITIWDWPMRKTIQTLDLKGDPLSSFAISHDGKVLATGSYVGHWRDENEKWHSTGSGTVRLWDIGSGEMLYAFPGDSSQVTGVAFSPDGRYLAVGGYGDRALKLCDPRTGRVLHSVKLSGQTSNVTALAFSPRGRFIGIGTFDGEILVWSMRSGNKIKGMKPERNPYGSQSVNEFVFSPDGALVAGANDTRITLWDTGSWQEVRTLDAGAWAWKSLCFSPDGKTLAAGTSRGTIIILETGTGRDVQRIDYLTWFERRFKPLLDWLDALTVW